MKKQLFFWLYAVVLLFTITSLAMFLCGSEMIIQMSVGAFIGLIMSIIIGQSINTEEEPLFRFLTAGSLLLAPICFIIFSLSFPSFLFENIIGFDLSWFLDLIFTIFTIIAVLYTVTRKSVEKVMGNMWKKVGK